MDDGAGDARFVEQHVDELGLGGELRQEHLDRHVALEAAERLHARAEDLGHAAATDPLDQRVAVEPIAHLHGAGHGHAASMQARSVPISRQLTR